MVLPMPPPVPAPEVRPATAEQGSRITLAGLEIEAPWQWVGDSRQHPAELWLTLDVLTGRFGFQRQPGLNGEELHWYGQQQRLQTIPTRTLDDEVAIDASPWLRRAGVQMRQSGNGLSIDLPAPRLLNLRQGKGSTANRLVMDLSGPALLQRDGDDLLLSLRSTPTQDGQLRALGLRPWRRRDHLRLRGQGSRLSTLTLATPWRVVLDGVGSAANRAGTNATSEQKALQSSLLNPVVQGLLRQGLVLDRRTVTVGVKPLIVYRIGTDPSIQGLSLLPLAPRRGQQGLRFLHQLTRPDQALFAVNGGFFNRIRQLPLGAVKRDGIWLSGPILNRGAIGWSANQRLLFGRLRLDQELSIEGGRRWRLNHLNSGYVQKGLSRYDRSWGPVYKALSGQELAITVVDGVVQTQHDRLALNRGVPIPAQGDLVVARGGTPIPARPGQRVTITARPSDRLGLQPQVLGGGPLLLQRGRVVLNGRQEGFSSGFLSVSAPRTVVGQDQQRQWLLTIKGAGGSHPTLLESSLALQKLGVSDALNLDGGSSTSMVVADRLVMTGRGVAPRMQNALGLVRD